MSGFVQGNYSDFSGAIATTQSLSFASLPAAGDAVIVSFYNQLNFSAQTATGCIDNQGNIYSLIQQSSDGAKSDSSMWWCPSIGTPSGTFTVSVTSTITSVTGQLMAIMEAAGLTGSVDKSFSKNDNNGSDTSATINNSAANSNANCFVVACLAGGDYLPGAAITSPASSGYTAWYNNSEAHIFTPAQGSYKTVSAIETDSATWSWTGTTDYSAIIASFPFASAAPTAPSVLLGQALT